MPWIFLTLLLANLAYFGWGMMQGSSAPRVSVAVSEDLPADKRLILLSERADLGGRPVEPADTSSPDAGATQASAAGPLCFTVGPFADNNPPGRFVDRMTARHLITRVDEEQDNSFDYWVFIAPQVDRAHADERQQELRRQGIEATIVDEDPFSNAISLGHFPHEDAADSFRNKMLAANVQAELRKIPQPGVEHWVFVTSGSTKADVSRIIDAAIVGIPAVSKQPASCET